MNRNQHETAALVEEGSAFLSLRREDEPLDVIVIGAGQSGLSVGYHLARKGLRFVILDANERVGDAWRKRWDSLRLFTPAKFDGLVGMPFPAPRDSFPTKDEMADYLEAYAKRFELPVANGVRVERLRREGETYVVTAGKLELRAAQVVVAMATYQKGRIPDFASQLDSGILQLHSSDYRNPGQLRPGGVLLVGAGNSGAEIALDVARSGAFSLPVGPRRGTRSVPHRKRLHAPRRRALSLPRRVPPSADARHAARPQAAAEDRVAGRASDPRPARGPRGGRRRAHRPGRGGARRTAAHGRRPRPRGRQRRLGGGVPSRLRVDRPADREGRARRPGPVARRRRERAGALLRRDPLPLRHVVHDDPRRGARRRARGEGGREEGGARG